MDISRFKRGRKAEYPWQDLQQPGDLFYVEDKTAVYMSSTAAKAARRIGQGAVIKCITSSRGGCWVLLDHIDEEGKAPAVIQRGPEDEEDPDADIAEYLVEEPE